MNLIVQRVTDEQFNEIITEGEPVRAEREATDAAPSSAETRVTQWIEAALNRYPLNWAFDATNPALIIDNIISGATAEAWNKTGQVESLFSVTMKEIHDEAEGALGYPQVCDALTAVRRLAVRVKELEARITELEAQLASSPCPHVITSREGTSHCALAEGSVRRLEAHLTSAEQFARDIAVKLNIPYEPPVEKGECKYLAAIENLKERETALRTALEQVEWHRTDTGWAACPWCRNWEWEGHKPDCARQAARGPQEGSTSGKVVFEHHGEIYNRPLGRGICWDGRNGEEFYLEEAFPDGWYKADIVIRVREEGEKG